MSAAPPALYLVTGGARSGKSAFAERLVVRLGARIAYVATAQARDAEMAARVARHRAARPRDWMTLEAPLDPAPAIHEAVRAGCQAILIDCLNFYVTNHLLDLPAAWSTARREQAVLEAVDRLLVTLSEAGLPAVLVTNEAGWGLVPENRLGREFRDVLGLANQRASRAARATFLVVAGRAVELTSLERLTAFTDFAEAPAETSRSASPQAPAIAPAIMIQGTASHVGKSLLVAAICRIFHQDGLRVRPFKSQNMALNSAVTADGGEIGRAQALQAEACGVEPSIDMNPVLLKPKQDSMAQLVVHGRPLADVGAVEYREAYVPRVWPAVLESLERLRREADVLVIEGAGSPAEINLRDRDIANMAVAEAAGAPVLLVADIDRGGVFASLLGTLELLRENERARVAGLVINKFRGDPSLLDPGIVELERRSGIPVLGVVPYLQDLNLPEEDSVALEGHRSAPAADAVEVAVVRLPRISNFTDVDLLRLEPGVHLRWVQRPRDLDGVDAVILPGSKNTSEDLVWLQETGLAAALRVRARDSVVLGICGGYQMLGERLLDPEGVESDRPEVEGLGLLAVTTYFTRDKVLTRRGGRVLAASGFWKATAGRVVEGYEIHMGRTEGPGLDRPFLKLASEGGNRLDGSVSPDGLIAGTYLHGILDADEFRHAFVDGLRARRGLSALPAGLRASGAIERSRALDRLASVVREHLDLDRVYRLVGLPAGRGRS